VKLKKFEKVRSCFSVVKQIIAILVRFRHYFLAKAWQHPHHTTTTTLQAQHTQSG